MGQYTVQTRRRAVRVGPSRVTAPFRIEAINRYDGGGTNRIVAEETVLRRLRCSRSRGSAAAPLPYPRSLLAVPLVVNGCRGREQGHGPDGPDSLRTPARRVARRPTVPRRCSGVEGKAIVGAAKRPRGTGIHL